MQRPIETEYATFYRGYVGLVPETDIVGVLEPQVEEIRRLLASVPAEQEGYRYAEGKWSIRQVLGHLVDAERVFGYRAFCFSRGEPAALPPFDENQYVAAARSDSIPLRDLISELAVVRQANLVMLRRLDARELQQAAAVVVGDGEDRAQGPADRLRQVLGALPPAPREPLGQGREPRDVGHAQGCIHHLMPPARIPLRRHPGHITSQRLCPNRRCRLPHGRKPSGAGGFHYGDSGN